MKRRKTSEPLSSTLSRNINEEWAGYPPSSRDIDRWPTAHPKKIKIKFFFMVSFSGFTKQEIFLKLCIYLLPKYIQTMSAYSRYAKRKRKERKPKRQEVVLVTKKRKAKRYKELGIGFPKKQTIHMRYVEQTVVDSTGLSTKQAFFGANNINDPDAALGGSRPLAWTEWSAFYNHYVVVSSSIKLTIFPVGNTATVPNMIGVFVSDDLSTTPDYRTLAEQGRGVYKMVPTAATTKGPTTLYCKFNAKSFFNITDIKDNVDRLGAAMTDNPAESAFFNIWAQPIDQTTNTGGFYMNVQIDYYVSLSEPKELVAS